MIQRLQPLFEMKVSIPMRWMGVSIKIRRYNPGRRYIRVNESLIDTAETGKLDSGRKL